MPRNVVRIGPELCPDRPGLLSGCRRNPVRQTPERCPTSAGFLSGFNRNRCPNAVGIRKYVNQTVGINWSDPNKFRPAKLTRVTDEYFSVFVAQNRFTIHYVRGGGNMAQYGRFENGPGHWGLRASRRGPTDLSAGPWEAVRCGVAWIMALRFGPSSGNSSLRCGPFRRDVTGGRGAPRLGWDHC